MYSRTGKAKSTPNAVQHCVKEIYVFSPGLVPFTATSLLEKGEGGFHEFSNKVARTMTEGSSPNKWKQSWNTLLSKQHFNDKETALLTLDMRLVSTLIEFHHILIGDALFSTTIMDAQVELREVLGELWTQDTVIEEAGKVMEKVC